MAAINRPSSVWGTASPYPVVVNVSTAHHNESGMVLKLLCCNLPSTRYMAMAANSKIMIKRTSTVLKGLASRERTRPSLMKSGESVASGKSHNEAKSHAVSDGICNASAIGTGKTLNASIRNDPDDKYFRNRVMRSA